MKNSNDNIKQASTVIKYTHEQHNYEDIKQR